VNYSTGQSDLSPTALSGVPGTGRRMVADDGTVLNVQGSLLVVMRPKQLDVTIPLSFTVANVTIAPDASYAIAQTADETPMLWLVNLWTYQSMPVAIDQSGVRAPALSEDGMTLMFLTGANWAATNDSLATQVWTMDMLTGHVRQWSSDAAGIKEATISGDGRVVWAVNNSGRLLRIEGETTTALEAAPVLDSLETSGWAPGSRYVLTGSGLTGATLSWQGTPIPVLRQTANEIEFIVPWAAALGAGSFAVERADSPFQANQLAGSMTAVAPRFIQTESLVWGLRADGSPLMLSNPAQPGEVIALMMRGLGPCDAAGNALGTFTVTVVRDSTRLEVVSATADAGTPGTYLLRVRVPESASGTLYVWVGAAESGAGMDAGNIPVAGY
jgi:uncharacterized protein (TIGR03437 family)